MVLTTRYVIYHSQDKILDTCKYYLCNKELEQLIGVPPLKMGGPLVLKLILDFFMEVEDSALRHLVQSIQVLWMEDVPGGNVLTVVSYLKV